MATLSALVSGLDAELRRLGCKDSTLTGKRPTSQVTPAAAAGSRAGFHARRGVPKSRVAGRGWSGIGAAGAELLNWLAKL
jgi:hypothetical protein